MKAIKLLKEYSTIDFGCDMSELYFRINEAISELEQLKANYNKINDSWVDCVERYESAINKQIIQESKSCENCKYYEVRNIDSVCSWCERHPSRMIRNVNIKDYWESKL